MTPRPSAIAKIKGLYFFLIVSLVPFLKPPLALNTILFDYVNGLFMFLFLIHLLVHRKIAVPLLPAMLVIALGSLLAMFDSHSLVTNLVAIAQEIYLFTFFIVLYNIIDTEDDIRWIAGLWILFSAAEGGLILADLAHAISTRGQGTFENPNMAGSYLGVSFFIAFYPFRRARWLRRLVFAGLALGGMFASKSISALLAFGVGCCVAGWGYLARVSSGGKLRLAVALVALVAVGVIFFPGVLGVHNYLDRLPQSVDERVRIWQAGLETFVRNPLGTTIGPAGFLEAGYVVGGHWGVGRHISLHSDYLSFLVERGVVGLIGLLLLLSGFAGMLRRRLMAVRSREDLLWILGLCAMLVFIVVDAMSHEVMHYRHVWLAFILIAAEFNLVVKRDRSYAVPRDDRDSLLTG